MFMPSSILIKKKNMQPIILPFQKQGIVSVGTQELSQTINLLNPVGYPTDVRINLQSREIELTIHASDDRNSVVRNYTITLDSQATLGFLQFFSNEIRRITRDNFEEFKDLTELPPTI